jgi:hypothetical protein
MNEPGERIAELLEGRGQKLATSEKLLNNFANSTLKGALLQHFS